MVEAEYNVHAEAVDNNKLSNKTPQTASTPVQTKTELNVRQDSLVQAFKESLLISKLPTFEPIVFKGDSLKFTEGSTIFKALIEKCRLNSAYKLFYLKKCISGETLLAQEGIFYQKDEETYTQVWDIQHKRYGQPFVIQRAFREKLNSWPKIEPRESFKLRDFIDFLVTCGSAMPHIPPLQVLNDCITERWNGSPSRYI